MFELNDHLGNVRDVVAANSTTGAAETISYTDYYPHGGPMPGRDYTSSLNFPYGYQGQEKDQNTGLTNFELRQYDPRIGRWYNPDPMGQHHSPYLAMSNNPVSFTDADGGWDGFGGGPNSDDAWRDYNFAQMGNPSSHFMNGDMDRGINGAENMAMMKNAYNRYRAEHTNAAGEWGNWMTGGNVRDLGDESHTHFDVDESMKIDNSFFRNRGIDQIDDFKNQNSNFIYWDKKQKALIVDFAPLRRALKNTNNVSGPSFVFSSQWKDVTVSSKWETDNNRVWDDENSPNGLDNQLISLGKNERLGIATSAGITWRTSAGQSSKGINPQVGNIRGPNLRLKVTVNVPSGGFGVGQSYRVWVQKKTTRSIRILIPKIGHQGGTGVGIRLPKKPFLVN